MVIKHTCTHLGCVGERLTVLGQGAAWAQQGRSGALAGAGSRAGRAGAKNSRVRTNPCDKWYQSEVGSFWDGFRWISSLRSWGLRGTVASMVMLLGLRS